MERGPLSSPDLITPLTLKQRRELASRLFGVRLPVVTRKQPDAHEMARRDLAIWLVRHPMKFDVIPSNRKLERVMGIDRRRIHEITQRLVEWSETHPVAVLILGRIRDANRLPFSEGRVMEIYAQIRKPGTWPWQRHGTGANQHERRAEPDRCG